VSSARTHVVERADVARWLPERPRETHKWRAAVWVIAGSPGMTGAAHLATRAAQRAGAGYVRLSTPGVDDDPGKPTEAVSLPLPAEGWAAAVVDGADRFGSIAVGPGLGTAPETASEVRRLVHDVAVPIVVDGDGLTALGRIAAEVVAGRSEGTVLTPHDGELARLGGDADEPDRIAETRRVASAIGAVVLRKGSTTVVAAPDGTVLLATAGDARLATAGTGDVLTGLLGALLAQGVAPLEAAAAAAHLHGRAGALAWRRGMVAGDLVDRLPEALSELPED
jgi:NAD(P)H-hydrate epimerase